ncbi:MAG: hypothetical protein WC869_00965 [Phycisphaerae bacterium]|jgi:hypothetical protein
MPTNAVTPNPGPQGQLGQPIKPDKTGHVQRALPTVKTVSEAMAKRANETGDKAGLVEQDPVEAGASLLKYNDEVVARLKQVQEYFKKQELGTVDPTGSKDFTGFIRGHLAYVNMRFVTMGRFERPGQEDANSKVGFQPLPDAQESLPGDLDPFLRGMRSTALAIQNGADLIGDDKSEPA